MYKIDLIVLNRNDDIKVITVSDLASAPQTVKREGDQSLRSHQLESGLPAVKVMGAMVAALGTV